MKRHAVFMMSIMLVITFLCAGCGNKNVAVSPKVDVDETEAYTPKVLSYLEDKYGSDAHFEVESVTTDESEMYGDGYAMGLEPEPIVIDKWSSLKANVKWLDTQTDFVVTGGYDMLGVSDPFVENDADPAAADNLYDYTYCDDLVNVLFHDSLLEITTEIKDSIVDANDRIDEVSVCDYDATLQDYVFDIKDESYHQIPDKDDLTFYSYCIGVNCDFSDAADQLSNARDILDLAKSIYTDVLDVLSHQHVVVDEINVYLFSGETSVTATGDVLKKNVSVTFDILHNRITVRGFDGVFDQYVLIEEVGEKKDLIKHKYEGSLTYYEMKDGTWYCYDNTYQYRLEFVEESPEVKFTYVYLSNVKDVTFDEVQGGFLDEQDVKYVDVIREPTNG